MVVEDRADCTGRSRALVVWIEPAGCAEPAAGCAEPVPAGLLEALAERTDPLCFPHGRSICASGRP